MNAPWWVWLLGGLMVAGWVPTVLVWLQWRRVRRSAPRVWDVDR